MLWTAPAPARKCRRTNNEIDELAPPHTRSRFWGIVATQMAILEGLGHVRFGSKADMCSALAHVRFTPESGHVRMSALGQKRTHAPHKKRSLFDDLISDGEHTRRNSEADRLCGREVYYELEFG